MDKEATPTLRSMLASDADAVSALCMAAFNKAVAPTQSEEGIATFAAVATAEAFLRRMQEDNRMVVAEQAGVIIGIGELKQGRHVAMLFVAPDAQQHGVGRALMTALLEQAREPTVTVSASPSSVPAYQRYGFQSRGELAQAYGLVYQPMEYSAPV